MVFSSVTFLFFFLPITIVLYFFMRNRPVARNVFLLVVSLIFYFWGERAYAILLVAVIAMNYFFGLWMAHAGPRRKMILITAIVSNLLLLLFFKYSNFFMNNLNALIELLGYAPVNVPRIYLPSGISFFIFAIMSYVIDLYRGKTEVQRNPLSLGLYLSLFPKLMQGPIERYGDIVKQFIERRISPEAFACGVRRFIVGLAKKVLIANTLAVTVNKIFSTPAKDLSADVAWLGIAGFILQLYFDFSGYTDMAIGLGKMFGFTFRENFNYPYIARSFRDFWQRWHLTLTSWFRDYLYIPLGGSRVSRWRGYYNIIFVFLLTGMWHGASWTFICWGLFNGVFLVFERLSKRFTEKIWKPLGNIYFLVFYMISIVMFRSDTMVYAAGFIAAMFGITRPALAQTSAIQFLSNNEVLVAYVVAIAGSRPIIPFMRNKIEIVIGKLTGRWQKALNLVFSAIEILVLAALLILSCMSLTSDTYIPFIYQQF
jgi:alginate O-acetyltransferase complex protein AlgI